MTDGHHRSWARAGVRAASDLREALSDLAAALDGAAIPWYIFGARAVIAHGRPRLTADIDVMVGLAHEYPNGVH